MITELGRADVPRVASLFAGFTPDRARLESYLCADETRIWADDPRMFVDDPTGPTVAMLVSPAAIVEELAFLAGDPAAATLRPLLEHVAAIPGVRDPLMFSVPTPQWEAAISREFAAGVCPIDRITYASFRPDCAYIRSWRDRVPAGCTLRRIDRDWLDRAAELDPGFWPDREKFHAVGIGFCLCQDSRVLSMAHSVWRPTRLLELEVATAKDVRGRGYSPLTCAPLIEYCLDRGIEPAWSCFAWNHASQSVARKLGFADPVHHTWFKWTPFNAHRRMVVLPATTLHDYVGHYRMKTIPAEIRVDGDGLLYVDEHSQLLSLAAEAPDRFFFRHFDFQVEFTRSCGGRVDGLIRHQSGRQFRAERV
jgi:RimJ/RimL family protein N-acetyltransferase